MDNEFAVVSLKEEGNTLLKNAAGGYSLMLNIV